MQYAFNLIDQPWIPALDFEGRLRELALRELLADAHQLRAIHAETPIASAAIMPMTLALLHRVFGPASTVDWWRLWDAGQFHMAKLDDYFTRWYARFDLFHPERPFYQVRDTRVKPKPVIELSTVQSKGDILFNHDTEDTKAPLTPAEAARELLAAHLFRSGGGKSGQKSPYFVDGLLRSGVIFFAQGRNLFETLMLNLLPYPSETYFPTTPDDKPVWEKDDPAHQQLKERQELPVAGYLDYLTWQTNHIYLFPEELDGQVVVRQFQIVPVAKPMESILCPMKRYVKKSKEDVEEGWSFLYFNEEKALWRDYHTMLPRDDTNAIRPPLVVSWLAQLQRRIDLGYPITLLATGVLADQAKTVFYRHEQVPLPQKLLNNDEGRAIVERAIAFADNVADSLKGAVNALADSVLQRGADGKPDSTTRGNLVKQWDVLGVYWAQLEAPFWELVDAVAQGSQPLDDWIDKLEQAAFTALDRAAAMSGDAPWVLEGEVKARRILRGSLNKKFEKSKQGRTS